LRHITSAVVRLSTGAKLLVSGDPHRISVGGACPASAKPVLSPEAEIAGAVDGGEFAPAAFSSLYFLSPRSDED